MRFSGSAKRFHGAWGGQRAWRLAALAFLVSAGFTRLGNASLSVLVGEPFGHWGTVMPLGHSAVFLDKLCADGPLHVRACEPGESRGVVLARYESIGQYDWMASPVLDFLFATPNSAEIPAFATPHTVWSLRQRFRERFLRSVVPDGTEGHEVGDGRAAGAGSVEEWWESAGMAYNRRVWAYQVETTAEQDRAMIRYLNSLPNHHLYHLKKTNCADFAAQLVNVIFPRAVHNDRIADFGLMTPKQVARSLVAYASTRPELGLRVWQIPQLPGSLLRSKPVRGGAESGLKTKRYLFPLLIIQPEVPTYLAIIYLWHGRWFLGQDATPLPAHTLPPSSIAGTEPPSANSLDAAQRSPISTPNTAAQPASENSMAAGHATSAPVSSLR